MYEITRDYIKFGKSRSGQQIKKVLFIVSHDTGNPGSTAYQNRSYFNNQQPSASAHTFIDDKYILEIIPIYEKAWHVQYQKTRDNEKFGDDANDAAIGVELCWGPGINFEETYKRYVWYHAQLCETFNLNPRTHIVSHAYLDPERKTDPIDCFKRHGITWNQFIEDVVKAMGLEGWKKENSVWYYYKNGTKQTGWLKDKGKWYYLNANGSMATGWAKVNDKWYFLDESGAMKTGWLKDKSKWYFLSSSGAMLTGLIQDKGKYYYLESDGAMRTTDIKINPDGSLKV
jgi:N-acetyl-anhydromuramyl-L-alanine amidase AmpD